MGKGLVHLHAHSTYSPLDGYGTTDQIAARVKELDQWACAQTDHGNCYGHVPWHMSAKKAGFKALFGCEFYIVEDVSERTRHQKSLGVDAVPHITVIARTQEGYSNFLQLIERATKDGFYYRPRIDRKMLFELQKGLTVLSGCPTGFPTRHIALGQYTQAEDFIRSLRDNCESTAVECVAQPGYGPAEHAGARLFDIADRLGMRKVLTGDCHFPRPTDHDAQDLMVHIALGVPLGQPKGVNLPAYQYYCSADELYERAMHMSAAGEVDYGNRALTHDEVWSAINETSAIAEECEVEIGRGKSVFFPDTEGMTSAEYLVKAAKLGLERRLAAGQIDSDRFSEYVERMEREIGVINGKGFADYILAVTDICLKAKSWNTLVMCRGSAGGSLLLYLLGASETDAVLHDLSFERFYDDTRPDPPDVDVDFEVSVRPKIIEYIFEKYGEERCAQILALTLMRATSAVGDVAKAMCLPRSEYEALSMALDSKDDDFDGQIEDQTDPTIIAVIEVHPRLRMAAKLMGQVRQTSTHAAGILVSAEPLNTLVAVLRPAPKAGQAQQRIASCDKHAAAQLNLLKFDLLSVMAFDVTAKAARRVGLTMEDLYGLKFDDTKVFDTARSGDVVGVFQLDGAALKVGREIGLDSFDELFAASALCRPGAMDFVPLYKKNKESGEEFDKYMAQMDPRAAKIIKPTYGVVLYQEQMMAMAREMAGMDWPTVHKLRKRVAAASFNGHALGVEFGDPFINGCVENGISKEEAEHWWSAIKMHGIYSFNKSHCVTYAIVSYWMLWLKTYHPEAYYEAFLSCEGAEDNPNMLLMKRLIREWRLNGGKVQLISKSRPTQSFESVGNGIICGGWANINGIGQTTAQKIIDNGPYERWVDLAKVVPPGVYGGLFESGITGEMTPSTRKRLRLAPWFPVMMTEETIQKTIGEPCDEMGVLHPGDLPYGESIFDVAVRGYVSSRQKKGRTGSFKGDTYLFTLEDETGAVTARVASRRKALQVEVKENWEVGDYVVAYGWWTGDGTLFLSDFRTCMKWNHI